MPVGLLCSALIYAHALHPLRLTAYSKDPSAQLHGWAEFAAEVDAVRRANGACWIATSSYATTGQLAYHLRAQAAVIQLDEPLRYVPPSSARCADSRLPGYLCEGWSDGTHRNCSARNLQA